MRRALSYLSAVTLAFGVGVATAGSASAGPVLHAFFNGRIAMAAWGTCSEPLQLGENCFSTEVIASDSKSFETSDQASGAHFIRTHGDDVVLRHYWSTVVELDGQLVMVPTKESFGGTSMGGTADVVIDNRLRTAHAVASGIPMSTYDYVTGEETTEIGSVDATWTGTGALTPIKERSIYRDLSMHEMDFTGGWQRTATATGTDGGAPIPGTVMPDYTWMASARQGSLTGYFAPVEETASLNLAAQAVTGRAGGAFTQVSGGASWSSCETAQPGDTCRIVNISLSRFTLADPRAPVDNVDARVIVDDIAIAGTPDSPEWSLVRETFAFTSDASVAVASDLSTGSVSAVDAQGKWCDYDPAGDVTACGPTTVSFGAELTGTGAPSPVKWHWVFNGLDSHHVEHAAGANRDATATGTVDGVTIGEPLYGASLSYASGRLLDRSS